MLRSKTLRKWVLRLLALTPILSVSFAAKAALNVDSPSNQDPSSESFRSSL